VISFAKSRRVNGKPEPRVASPFAMQTGGAFVGRTGGLTEAEVGSVMAAINLLS